LREYDAYLLNYYNKVKAHKKGIKSIKRDASKSREEREEISNRASINQHSQSMLVKEDAIVEVAPTPPPIEIVE